eukprot:3240520-Amphidinium_carterae.1
MPAHPELDQCQPIPTCHSMFAEPMPAYPELSFQESLGYALYKRGGYPDEGVCLFNSEKPKMLNNKTSGFEPLFVTDAETSLVSAPFINKC